MISNFIPPLRQFLNRHVLGLAPDPETWPVPPDIAALPVPVGIDQTDTAGPAWILAAEKEAAWHKRRTVVGAQSYRFVRNGEYDCGWRLVDLAGRFLTEKRANVKPDIVTILPPPPLMARVPALTWSSRRLAELFDAQFMPHLFGPVAPIGQHPDLAPRLPTIPTEFYTMAQTTSLNGKVILLCDWRWHRGRMITILARRLAKAGAVPVRFVWLD